MGLVSVALGAAAAAVDEAADAGAIPDFELLDVAADLGHDPNDLVAWYDGVDAVSPLRLQGQQDSVRGYIPKP